MCAAPIQVPGPAQANKRRSFNPDWEVQYFFSATITDTGKVVCLVCFKEVQVKKYNIERHFKSHHAAAYANLSAERKSEEVARLKETLQTELETRKEQAVSEI